MTHDKPPRESQIIEDLKIKYGVYAQPSYEDWLEMCLDHDALLAKLKACENDLEKYKISYATTRGLVDREKKNALNYARQAMKLRSALKVVFNLLRKSKAHFGSVEHAALVVAEQALTDTKEAESE